MNINLRGVLVFRIAICLLIFSASQALAQWEKQDVKTDASFRGLDVVDEKTVWASGTGGTVIRTIDGGKNWDVIIVNGAEKLDFRDIEAFDENTAYILSIGNGENSRIYKTIDGGVNWKLQFKNTDEKAFFDSIAFWDEKNGMAQSDPVDGKYVLYRTTDGENWSKVDTANMSAAMQGEAAFAASGTCIVTKGENKIWLITGGTASRVFVSGDRGNHWNAYDAPIVNGTAGSGIFGISMQDELNGILVGGNYEKPNDVNANMAFTNDGGRIWTAAKGLRGYRSGVWLTEGFAVAVGTSGADISTNGGKNWKAFGSEALNTVDGVISFSDPSNKIWEAQFWAVGPNGWIGSSGIGRERVTIAH